MEENFKTLVQSKSGLRMVCSSEAHRSAFEMALPHWSPDSDFVSCSSCQSKFDFLKRKHHCRRCGLIFCNNCCNQKSAHPRMCFVDPVRMCAPCASKTRKENDFFDKSLLVLTRGSTANVAFKRMPSESDGRVSWESDSNVTPESPQPRSHNESNSDLTFFLPEESFESIDRDLTDLSLGGDSRELRCALCPLHRNLIFMSAAHDDCREVARFDMTQLTSCHSGQSPSDAFQGNHDSFPTTSSMHSLSSQQSDPDVTPPFPNQITVTFCVPSKGFTSDHSKTMIVTLAPIKRVRSSRDDEQHLRWLNAFQKASQLLINTLV